MTLAFDVHVLRTASASATHITRCETSVVVTAAASWICIIPNAPISIGIACAKGRILAYLLTLVLLFLIITLYTGAVILAWQAYNLRVIIEVDKFLPFLRRVHASCNDYLVV